VFFSHDKSANGSLVFFSHDESTNGTFMGIGLKAFSIVELPEATYMDPYRDGLRHGWTCRVLNGVGEGEVAIDAPVVHNIWRLQHFTCLHVDVSISDR
jgi:hypothetical protein